ncbi:MAG TPA: phosphopantothenoylcysteine decarboxylase [Dysgonamonadaceae bacterium]|nr:phosphopantothenoylcysteine decarboxylase [Dysgonamonadaceae bacterium]
MIHIAITAGGTEEAIDGVRKITNMSSGSLSWHCLEVVLSYMHKHNNRDFTVHYIKAPRAVTNKLNPEQTSHINFIEVTNTQSVYDAVKTLMNEVNVDIFIHAMAISDFAYSYSVSKEDLAEELYFNFVGNNNITIKEIKEVLSCPKYRHRPEDKISSSQEIIMGFETTPKVISLIKKMNAKTFLVGFKLVKHNEDNHMIKQAEKLRKTNNCDAVFANEASQLSVEGHAGVLLYKGEPVAHPIGKKEIAKAIVNLAFDKIN